MGEPGGVVLHLAEHGDDGHQDARVLQREQRVDERPRSAAYAASAAVTAGDAAPVSPAKVASGRRRPGSAESVTPPFSPARPPAASGVEPTVSCTPSSPGVWETVGVDDVTWGALTLTLTLLGGIWTWLAFRRRGVVSGLRGAAFTLLPAAAWLTGTLQLFTRGRRRGRATGRPRSCSTR